MRATDIGPADLYSVLDGIEFLRRIRKQSNCPPVVVLTAFASSENTIEAMRLGAFDHLTKPIGRDELASLLARMLSARKILPSVSSQPKASADALVGSSEAMRRVQKMIGLAADTDTTVLILGETGTGKEVVARALHEHSRRKGKPFIAVNCAAIPAELLESELFGHVRGAFTGATFDRPGAFREADGGTILLDEIGDMSAVMQAKILPALQERVVTPLGGKAVNRRPQGGLIDKSAHRHRPTPRRCARIQGPGAMVKHSDMRSEPGASRIRRPLDALNFFLADVRGGLGPYLATYLLTVRHWDEASIGLVMSIATLAGLLAQTPAGALVDAARAKRAVIVTAALLVAFASLSLPWLSDFWPVAASQAAAHAAAAVFAPAIAAITLGAVGRAAFAHRIGRNESFNHAGNAFAAAVAGVSAYVWGPVVVFFLLAAMSLASLASALMIPANAIDHDLARGLDDGRPAQHGGREDHDQPSGLEVLVTCRPLLVFAVCVALFHFANAAMLPLVGQKLALKDQNLGTSLMSACILAAQLVMVPMAMLVGAKADAWGRKPLFLIALVILPIRGALYTFSDNSYWLVGVQLLDGVGAGIYGAIFPIIVADLMRGTGRFNVAQGAIITAQEIGAALSTAVAGFLVVAAGYSAAFLALAAIAATGLVLFWFGMPETSTSEATPKKPPRDDASAQTARPSAAPAE